MMGDFGVPHYAGFTYLQPLVQFFGLPIDQLNFVAAQIFGVILGYILRFNLGPLKTPFYVRHLFCLIVGFTFIFYCYGNECLHIVIMCTITYILIRLSKYCSYFHILVSLFVFSYLSLVHISRMRFNYQAYTLDITGPLMIMTQKLTNLAFSLHDGLDKNRKKLSYLLQKRAINHVPSVLEYLSYCMHFQTLLAGPLCFYKDYQDFIEGTNFAKYANTNFDKANQLNGSISSSNNSSPIDNKSANASENNIKPQTVQMEDLYNLSALRPCLIKGATAIVLAYFLLYIRPLFPIELNYNMFFLVNYGIVSRTIYLIISTSTQRIKYYFAWTCEFYLHMCPLAADLISNVSGLGFSGFEGVDDHNANTPEITVSVARAKWDLISNIDIPAFETATSLHGALNAWNISTMAWLRHLVYERVNFQRTLSVYAVSAVWHGFWPGYYFTFGTGALFTETAKMNRRKYRRFFIENRYVKFGYDCFTFLLTRVALAYTSAPFILLRLPPSLIIYQYMYYYLHVMALLSALLYYVVPLKTTITPSINRIRSAGSGLNVEAKHE